MLEELIRYGLSFFQIPHDDEQVAQLNTFLVEVGKWGAKINLTGLKELESFAKRLVFDAFFISKYFVPHKTALDMGSGAGVLSIPLSILHRDKHIFSVDARLKKIQFQRHVKRLVGLSNLTPIHARIEQMQRLCVEAIFVKGFGKTQSILDKGRRHLCSDGKIFIFKGRSEEQKEFPDMIIEDFVEYELPGVEGRRTLIIYRNKTSVIEDRHERAP